MASPAVSRKSPTNGRKRHSPPPFIHLLGENGNPLVLDVHTGRLFAVTADESEVLRRWLDGTPLTSIGSERSKPVREIIRLQKQGLFSCERPRALRFGATWPILRDKILHERYQTILELTQQCNLRCRYCAYSGGFEGHRTHRSIRMSPDLLRAAVAAAFQHGDALDAIALGFYGGEPLLAFDLLKLAVDQAERDSHGKKVLFSLTTNCTLVDVAKATFLRDHEFNILVSVDGPQYMHDRYRVFRDGRGSYAATMRGLQTLLNVFGDQAGKYISFNMVFPSSAWLPYLQDLWEKEPWIPRTLNVNASLMDSPPGLELPLPEPGARPPLESEWLTCAREGKAGRTMLASGVFDFRMAGIHQRRLFDSPRETFFPNACCLPGNRKVFVSAEGQYQICERVFGAPPIGSVNQGIDVRRIKALVDEYCRESIGDCRDCWALGLCPVCFSHAYHNGGFSIRQKRQACETMRAALEADLELYGFIAQEWPHKLQEWENIEIS